LLRIIKTNVIVRDLTVSKYLFIYPNHLVGSLAISPQSSITNLEVGVPALVPASSSCLKTFSPSFNSPKTVWAPSSLNQQLATGIHLKA
jgi:hypothetical protein